MRFTTDDLTKAGIICDSRTKNIFLSTLEEALTVYVGKTLADRLSESQLEEFDALTEEDPDAIRKWIGRLSDKKRAKAQKALDNDQDMALFAFYDEYCPDFIKVISDSESLFIRAIEKFSGNINRKLGNTDEMGDKELAGHIDTLISISVKLFEEYEAGVRYVSTPEVEDTPVSSLSLDSITMRILGLYDIETIRDLQQALSDPDFPLTGEQRDLIEQKYEEYCQSKSA